MTLLDDLFTGGWFSCAYMLIEWWVFHASIDGFGFELTEITKNYCGEFYSLKKIVWLVKWWLYSLMILFGIISLASFVFLLRILVDNGSAGNWKVSRNLHIIFVLVHSHYLLWRFLFNKVQIKVIGYFGYYSRFW